VKDATYYLAEPVGQDLTLREQVNLSLRSAARQTLTFQRKLKVKIILPRHLLLFVQVTASLSSLQITATFRSNDQTSKAN